MTKLEGPREWSPRLPLAWRYVERLKSIFPEGWVVERHNWGTGAFKIGDRVDGSQLPGGLSSILALIVVPPKDRAHMVWIYANGALNVEPWMLEFIKTHGNPEGFSLREGRYPEAVK